MQTSPAIVANIINPSIFTVTPVTRKLSSAIENNQRAYLCLETYSVKRQTSHCDIKHCWSMAEKIHM